MVAMNTTNQHTPGILAINGGSSSLKFALFGAGENLPRIFQGKFERIGLPDGHFTARDERTGRQWRREQPVPNHASCVPQLFKFLEQEASVRVGAVSHRIVHGGPRFHEPEKVTPDVIRELRSLIEFAPLHLPAQISLLEAFAAHFRGVDQVMCFDTGFHHALPHVARLLPIPRRYEALGLRRYGFHGLSYTFLMQELARVGGADAAQGRVILAHLGNGASLAAVRDGQPLDTTMAFTPAAGLVMSSRPGDIDPGLLAYLARRERMSAERVIQFINSECGLLGISETSPDIRDLLARENQDGRAADAVAVFCYQTRKWIGAMAAALTGLDTLVFSAGIGENAPVIRARICAGLEYLGVTLDPETNAVGATLISQKDARVAVRVLRTDEELCLAQSARLLASAGVIDLFGSNMNPEPTIP